MYDILGSGAGPAPLGRAGGSGLVVYPDECFQTQQIDLTQVASSIELLPAKPGYFPVLIAAHFLIEATSGTQTTPLTCRAGSDAGHVNFFPTTANAPSNADVNATNVPSISTSINAGSANNIQRIPNATVFFDITAGAQGTGGFTLRGKFNLIVKWVSVG